MVRFETSCSADAPLRMKASLQKIPVANLDMEGYPTTPGRHKCRGYAYSRCRIILLNRIIGPYALKDTFATDIRFGE